MAKLLIHRLRWTSSAARRRWSGARRRSGTRMTWRLCWTRRRSSRVGTEFSICSVLFDVHLQDADHQNGQRAGEALDNLRTNMLNCGVTWSNPWGCVTDLWGGNCGPGKCLAPNRTWQERSLRAEEVLNATLDELAMCRWGNTSVGRNTTRRRRATSSPPRQPLDRSTR